MFLSPFSSRGQIDLKLLRSPRHRPERVEQLAILVQLRQLVAAAQALVVHEDVRHGLAARHLAENGLQLGAVSVLVKIHDGRRRVHGVVLAQDVLGFLAEGTVCFGEYSYCFYCCC